MKQQERLIAIDVFRGLTIAAMILVNFPGSWENVYAPLLHSKWNGVTPTDYIFPFFIFIVGVSVSLAYSRKTDAGIGRNEIVKRILIRGFKIWAVGYFLHYLPDFDFNKVDLFGVLQRIAIVFTVCAMLFIFTGWKTQIFVMAGILIFYWVTLSFIPTAEFKAGTLEPGLNFASWFDRLIFPARMLGRNGWNHEGLYSTLPAISSGIAGMLAGELIIRNKINERTIIWLFTAGAICILGGSLWDWQFPINKSIWTSSFVLFTTGWAVIILAISIWFIDFMGYKDNVLIKFAVIFGTNAIAIYVMADVFETFYKHTHIHDIVYYGLINNGIGEKLASLLWALLSLISCFSVAAILSWKKIYIKL